MQFDKWRKNYVREGGEHQAEGETKQLRDKWIDDINNLVSVECLMVEYSRCRLRVSLDC